VDSLRRSGDRHGGAQGSVRNVSGEWRRSGVNTIGIERCRDGGSFEQELEEDYSLEAAPRHNLTSPTKSILSRRRARGQYSYTTGLGRPAFLLVNGERWPRSGCSSPLQTAASLFLRLICSSRQGAWFGADPRTRRSPGCSSGFGQPLLNLDFTFGLGAKKQIFRQW